MYKLVSLENKKKRKVNKVNNLIIIYNALWKEN